MYSTSSEPELGPNLYFSLAQSNSVIYSRNDQSWPIREQNMHKNFAFVCEDHFVYGVLTGFETIDAVRYYAGILPHVISQNIQKRKQLALDCQQLDQFYEKQLRDAFITADEQYRQNKSDQLSEKTVFDIELHGSRPENYPTINDRIKELSGELSSGLSTVVALICAGRIYVANIGDTCAILCRKVVGDSGQDYIRAVPLSATHDLSNISELNRLSKLGLSKQNIDAIQQKGEIGNMSLTRCLGNLWLKSFYKDYDELASASQDPILAEPHIESITLDHTSLFLILASSSLMVALREATEKSNVTDDLVRMVNEEFQKQHDHTCVAQAVASQIRQMHENCFKSSSGSTTCRQIEDITLLIRDLTVDDRATEQPTHGVAKLAQKFDQLSISVENCNSSEPGDLSDEYSPSQQRTALDNDKTITDRMTNVSLSQTNLTDDSGTLNDDEDEIDAYVDFTELLQAYNEIPTAN